jgi:hypothetical protein
MKLQITKLWTTCDGVNLLHIQNDILLKKYPQNDSPWNTKDITMEGFPGYLFRLLTRLPEYCDLPTSIVIRAAMRRRYEKL